MNSTHTGASTPRHRNDIQILRGLAVLLVLVYHSGAGIATAGYLGVDIFFVISGYLITRMVAGQIALGRFRFGDFYLRRARRLLPAAYLTLALTTIAAIYLLDYREWNDFVVQLLGALTFTGNFALWQQAGYFSGAAELKPLLHIWSLAIEEQYYLVLPLFLVFIARRLWLPLAGALALASLALHIQWAGTDPAAAFYLLPSRGWELAVGSLLALAELRGLRPGPGARLAFWPALLALIAVPLWGSGLSTPFDNVLVCAAAAVVILRCHPILATGRANFPLVWVGDISYSLYLVHWPAVALARNALAGDPAGADTLVWLLPVLVLASIPVAWLMYRFVEQPARRAQFQVTPGLAAGAFSVTLLLALSPVVMINWVKSQNALAFSGLRIDRSDNVGFHKHCDFYQRFEPLEICRNADRPRIMVWGDSFAMHLVPGIASSTHLGVIQATKSSCAPLAGVAQIAEGFPRPLAEDCLSLNRSVLAYLATDRHIETVVLSSPYYPYFDTANRRLLVADGDRLQVEQPSMERALSAQIETIAALRSLGKRVVVVAPPPSNGVDYTHCAERKALARTLAAASRDCDMPAESYRGSKRQVLDFLQRLGQQANVAVLDFDALLCDFGTCQTALDGVMLYRDEGHFSPDGSRAVAARLGLGDRLVQLAR